MRPQKPTRARGGAGMTGAVVTMYQFGYFAGYCGFPRSAERAGRTKAETWAYGLGWRNGRFDVESGEPDDASITRATLAEMWREDRSAGLV